MQLPSTRHLRYVVMTVDESMWMYMKRLFAVLLLMGIVAIAQLPTSNAFAQTAPGVGHGFLIDKHLGAQLTCANCHTESTAKPPEMATCLSCHGGTYDALAKTTENDDPNPHASHRGELPCAECHHIHQASVLLCSQCHDFELKVP